MARIRSIKPESWRSRDMTSLSILGRLVFVVLITQADDEGRQHTDAHHIAAVHLSDKSLTPEVQSQLAQMERLAMIRRYKDVQGAHCLALLNWASHQKISHPSESRIQKPPDFSRTLRKPRERSPLIDQIDQIGGIGGEGSISPAASGRELALVSEISRNPVEQVFQAWVRSTGRSVRTLLDNKRRRFIQQALASYELDEVLLAVDGWRFSAHHRGENDRATKYNDLDLLLRDAKHIEMFRDLASQGAPVIPMKPSPGRALREQAALLRAGGIQ